MKWYQVEHNMFRAKVNGGWLVKVSNTLPLIDPRTSEILSSYGFHTESITFIPGEWEEEHD